MVEFVRRNISRLSGCRPLICPPTRPALLNIGFRLTPAMSTYERMRHVMFTPRGAAEPRTQRVVRVYLRFVNPPASPRQRVEVGKYSLVAAPRPRMFRRESMPRADGYRRLIHAQRQESAAA